MQLTEQQNLYVATVAGRDTINDKISLHLFFCYEISSTDYVLLLSVVNNTEVILAYKLKMQTIVICLPDLLKFKLANTDVFDLKFWSFILFN